MTNPNWGLLGNGQNALAMFAAGNQMGQQMRERHAASERKNALAAYVAKPGEDTLAPVIAADPETGLKLQRHHQEQAQDAQLKRTKIIGQAAQWADTPEKWDQALDYLVTAGYPELAQYKGKFDPSVRMAAISAAGDMAAYTERTKPVNMAPGGRLVDPTTGRVISEAPFAPRTATVREGETIVEYQPGGGGGGTSSDPKSIFDKMIGAESGGQHFTAAGTPTTSPAGAIGIAQVMPQTAPEAAQLAGLPWDENRYRSDPQYNRALGEAYFQKQVQDFGDPAMAVAAYNAGPGRVRAAVQKYGDNWLQHVPAETKAYVAKVMGGGNGGPRVIAQGAPKQGKGSDQFHTLSPQEVEAAGLPAGVYQRAPNGEIKPVAGTTGKNAPQNKEAYSQSALDAFDRAIGTANGLLKHPGLAAAVGSGFDPASYGSFNPWTGDTLAGTDAANFKTELDTMKAQVFLPMVQSMKGMGALSNAEGEKLTAAIGNLNPNQSETAFKASITKIIADLNTYKNRAKSGPAKPAAAKPSVSNW